MPSGSRSLLLRILVVILATLLGVALTEHASERLQQHYTGRAVLQIRSPAGAPPQSLDVVHGEITGRKLLEPVLKTLGQEPTEALFAQLQQSIRVSGYRGTALVEIGVSGTDSKVAADLANEIAAEYVRQKIAEQQAAITRELARLQSEVAAQRSKVQTLWEACTEIRVKEGITDLHPDVLGEEEKPLAEAIAGVRAEVDSQRALNAKMAALSDAQLLEEITNGSVFLKSLDPTLTPLCAELKNLTLAEQKLESSGSSPHDLKLQTIKSRKADLEKQLSQLVVVVRKRYEVLLSAKEAKLRMAEEIGGQKQPSAEAMARYREAKGFYLQERKKLEEMDLKFSTETMERTMPSNPATIWERAEPPVHADRPSAFLLALGGLLGLAVGLGLASLPRPGLTATALAILTAIATLRWWQAAIAAATNSLYQTGIL